MYVHTIISHWMIFRPQLGEKYELYQNGGPGGLPPGSMVRTDPNPSFFLHKMKAEIISFIMVGQTFQYVDK